MNEEINMLKYIQPLYLFEEKHLFGYKNASNGEIVIPPVYKNGKQYQVIIKNRNYFVVMNQDKWGLIDEHNVAVTEFVFNDIGRPKLEKGNPQFLMCFQQAQGSDYFKIGIISTELKIIIPPRLDWFPKNITVLGESTCWYYINQGDRWGALNSNGSVLMDTNYRKEEVTAQITAMCKDLIMEYQIRQDDSGWLKSAMLSRTYKDLFEWN
jgi:hypothetical protein